METTEILKTAPSQSRSSNIAATAPTSTVRRDPISVKTGVAEPTEIFKTAPAPSHRRKKVMHLFLILQLGKSDFLYFFMSESFFLQVKPRVERVWIISQIQMIYIFRFFIKKKKQPLFIIFISVSAGAGAATRKGFWDKMSATAPQHGIKRREKPGRPSHFYSITPTQAIH